MALDSQQFSLVFQDGLDLKSNSKTVVPTKLLELENATFIKPGQLSKCDGFKAESTVILNPPNVNSPKITSGRAITTFLDELVIADKDSLYSYNTYPAGWTYKGLLSSTYVSEAPVIRDAYAQTAADGITHPTGLQCYAWEDSSGGVKYSILDSSTGQVVQPPTVIVSTAVKPKVLVLTNRFVIVYVDTDDNKIYFATVPVAVPNRALTIIPVTGVSGATALNSTTPIYDACVVETNAGPQLYLIFKNAVVSPGPGMTAMYFIATNLTSYVDSVSYANDVTLLAIFGNSRAIILLYYVGSVLKFVSLSPILTGEGVAHTIQTFSGISSITGITLDTSPVNTFQVFWSKVFSDKQNSFTTKLTISTSAVTVAPSVVARSVALTGKPFTYEGRRYVPVAYSSENQPTYFLIDEYGSIVAKMLYGIGGGIQVRGDGLGANVLAESAQVSDTKFRFPFLAVDLLTTTTGRITTQTGVVADTVDFFNPTEGYLNTELGRNLHFDGGYISMYDGRSPVEHGYHLYPEPITIVNGSSSTGQLTGTDLYSYVATYEWTDAQGNNHISAPSLPVSVTANTNGSATVTIPTLRLTSKQSNGRSPVTIVVYRTTGNGIIYYRCCTTVPHASPATNQPIINDMSADTVAFIDTQIADETTNGDFGPLVGNPQLYTTGGVLENVEPGPVSSVTVWQNRMFALNSTNPLQIWYSKEVVPNVPVEFSNFLYLNIDPRGGPVTAIENMDDKLIVFKESSIYMVIGTGPDNTGSQDQIQGAILVTTDVGCVNPRSISVTPVGLMFQSEKGIYLLNRGLQVEYIGAAVETYNTATVTSATLMARQNQVRFTLDSKITLVYDYYVKQWSTFTIVDGLDATIWNELYTYIQDSGKVLTETPGVHTIEGAYISMKIVTAWLQLAGIQNFQRIRDMMILGSYNSPHQLQVGVAYDFNGSPTQNTIIGSDGPANFGDDSPFGSGTPFGGEFPLYQWRVYFDRQKCMAIQITLRDIPLDTTIGESLSMTGINLRVGVKKGHNKLSADHQFGNNS